MSHDLRKYARDTQIRLIIGGILVLSIVGDGLIYLIYGSSAALTGLLCIGLGLLPILSIIIVMAILEYLVRKNNRDE